MKKLIVILLLLSYGLSASGSTIYIHFCCGKIDAVKLVPVNDTKCTAGHAEKKPGCCDDKQLDLKISSEQKRETVSDLRLNFPQANLPTFLFQPDTVISIDQGSNYFSSSPSVRLQYNLYKFHCIYRI